ncbi:MAG: hypothetical protein HDR88_13985 [Bacteroides sp.]|nr:hypothetical protein [Bacteroides sp.]
MKLKELNRDGYDVSSLLDEELGVKEGRKGKMMKLHGKSIFKIISALGFRLELKPL